MNERKELRLQTSNGWTCESANRSSSYFSSMLPSSSSGTEEPSDELSKETDHLIIRCEDDNEYHEDHHHDHPYYHHLDQHHSARERDRTISSSSSSVSVSHTVISGTSNGLSQSDVRLMTEQNGAATLLQSNELKLSVEPNLANLFSQENTSNEQSLLIDQMDHDGLYCLSFDQYDPLQLPHPQYQFPHSPLILPALTTQSQTSNKYLPAQGAPAVQLRRRLSPRVAKQLNVDPLCMLFCILLLALCGVLHEYLLPHIDSACRTKRFVWLLWSNALSISAAAAGTVYLVGWFIVTKTRFYRQQTLFVLATILLLAIASANAMWAVSAFLKIGCQQELAEKKMGEQRLKSWQPDFEYLRLDNEGEHETPLDDVVDEISDIRPPIEPQPTMEALTMTTTTAVAMNQNDPTAMKSVIEPMRLLNNELIKFIPNLPPVPEWFSQLLFKYDLKVVGIFHWLITLILVVLTLRLMAKRRRYAIECLKQRGLLIQYYWVTMD